VTRTALYRFYDENSTLLYVGITCAPTVRWKSHSTRSWWPQVVRKDVEWHLSRETAEAEERRAIVWEKPRYNRAHNQVRADASKSWWPYVVAVSDNAPQQAIGSRTGINQSSIGRWRTSDPKPENVRAFALAYRRPVLEAFIAAGFITPSEANLINAPIDMAEISDDELLAEMHRRMRR
jgi:hypothetical protein